jgi:hypothetical protein
MTTAQLREAARHRESRCEWGRAAKLYRAAVAAYPSARATRATGSGSLRDRDIAALERRAADCEHMARLERDRDEHARRDAHSEE